MIVATVIFLKRRKRRQYNQRLPDDPFNPSNSGSIHAPETAHMTTDAHCSLVEAVHILRALLIGVTHFSVPARTHDRRRFRQNATDPVSPLHLPSQRQTHSQTRRSTKHTMY
jgi:hypothetical protein